MPGSIPAVVKQVFVFWLGLYLNIAFAATLLNLLFNTSFCIFLSSKCGCADLLYFNLHFYNTVIMRQLLFYVYLMHYIIVEQPLISQTDQICYHKYLFVLLPIVQCKLKSFSIPSNILPIISIAAWYELQQASC
jgi:hypothetical protein